MARKRGGGDEEQGANWMDTYGDMVTLILTFFVMLYSMSTIDQQKWQYIAQAFSSMGKVVNAVVAGEVEVEDPEGNLVEEAQLNAGEVPQNFDQLYQYLKQYIEQNDLTESIELEKGAANVYLKFRDNIFFSPDSDVLRQEGQEVLAGISPGIQAVDQFILGIRINGHTAEAELSKVNDRDLSTGRANAVLKYLDALSICPSAKFSASGYGKYRPEAPNDTEENRKLNRRVEIIIARNDVDYSNPAVIQEFFAMEYGVQFEVESDGAGMSPVAADSPADIAGDSMVETTEPAGTDSVSDSSPESTDAAAN